MRVLILNQNWFADELRALGHEVVTAGLSFASHLEVKIDLPMTHVDRVIQVAFGEERPDVILVHDNSAPICFSGLDEVDIPTAFYSVDTHHHASLHRFLGHVFDYTFIAQKDYQSYFAESGITTEWLPLWASRPVDDSDKKDHGAVFVGTMDPKLNPARVQFFEELQKEVPVLCTVGEFWKIFPFSQIVINQTVKGDLNFRVFEAMMCGPLLLTERSGNGLFDLFSDGVHLVTYSKGDVKEAADKIRYYLDNPQEARRIAVAGREEILRAHTPMARAKRVADVLSQLTKKKDPKKFFSMMINHAVIGRSGKTLGDDAKLLALAPALKAAQNGILYHEALDNAFSVYLVVGAVEYDRSAGSRAGYDLLVQAQKVYPNDQILNFAVLRGALNHGSVDYARELANQLGVDDLPAAYENADKIVRQLIDSI